MKKLLTILLSLAMILSMGSVAFADETEPESPYNIESTEEGSNSVDINVYAKYKAKTERIGTPTYKVVVTWTIDDPITIEEGYTTYKWNSETFKYDVVDAENSGVMYVEGNESDDWHDYSQVKANITVENKSDAFVNATITYVPEGPDGNPYSGIWNGDSFNTDGFNLTNERELGAVVYNLDSQNISAFDEYVLGLYTMEGYGIADGEELEDIGALINWLKTETEYSEKFIEFNPQNASDLLKLIFDEEHMLDPYGQTNQSIINNLAGYSQLKFPTGDVAVKLTSAGENYILNQNANSKIEVGHFNVKVEKVTNGEN